MTGQTKVLLAGALAPAAVILAWTYFRDRLREPPRVVLMTLLYGALVTIPIVFVEGALQATLGIEANPQSIGQAAAISFIVAALVEETFKFWVLWRYSARHCAFDEPYDGIVYGVAASLGFAAVENVMYVLSAHQESFESGLSVAFLRALLSVPLHAACGAIMGICVGIGRFSRGPASASWALLGLAGAIALHGAYDTFAFSAAVPAEAAGGVELAGISSIGVSVTTALGIAIAALAAARLRRDQVRARVTDPLPVPALPMVALVSSAAGALAVLAGAGIAVAFSAAETEPSEMVAATAGTLLLGGAGVEGLSALLALLALGRETRWRAASACALLVSGAMLGLVALALLTE
jgi:RsiW-degrading membrane proteinase PrsW (M82 family)